MDEDRLMHQFAAISRQMEDQNRDIIHNLVGLRKDFKEFFAWYKEKMKWSEYSKPSAGSTG